MKKIMKKDYIVNPENKVVISHVNTNEDIGYGSIYNECSKDNNNCKDITFQFIDLLMTDYPKLDILEYYKYKGVARCDEFDKFDEKIGKKIAGNKAELKYEIDMVKKYERLATIFKQAASDMYTLEIKHLEKIKKLKEEIKEYYPR